MKEQKHSVKPLVITSCIGLAASLLILLLAAWAVSAGHTANTQIFALAAIFAGSFISAHGAAAYFKRRFLVVGLTAALGFFLLVFLLGGIVYFRAVPATPVIGMLFASLAAGLAAGLLPRKKKTKRG